MSSDRNSQASTSKLELEPNPFEKSFSTPVLSQADQGTDGSPKPLLPPISHLDSPSIPGGQFWATSSLRLGPLSPSMLLGPQNSGATQTSTVAASNHSMTSSKPPISDFGMMPAQPSPMTAALINAAASGQFVATPGGSIKSMLSLPARQNLPVHPPPHDHPMAPSNSSSSNNNLYLLTAAEQELTRQRLRTLPAEPNPLPLPPPPPAYPAGPPPNPLVAAAAAASQASTLNPTALPSAPAAKAYSPTSHSPTRSTGAARRTPRRTSTAANSTPPKRQRSKDGADDGVDEKRRNFLERNRIAALKCRQRKKQWLTNLQQSIDMYTVENEKIEKDMQRLREEIINIKALLVAHKNCPVAQANGVMDVDTKPLPSVPLVSATAVPQPHACGAGDFNMLPQPPPSSATAPATTAPSGATMQSLFDTRTSRPASSLA
ncbi:Transcription factor [Dimargaris xerosporica]|nr:Transcription factor [Dimargaris xerosporica]